MKYLKLSPEYECSPLWVSVDGDFYENLNIDASPFNEFLRSKISDWAINFEGTLNQDYPPESGFTTFEDEEKFEQDGVEIWKHILSHYASEYDKVFSFAAESSNPYVLRRCVR
jgi:hypothetical protein